MQLSKFSGHIILAFFLIFVAQLFYAIQSGVFTGQLVDPDCYTWLVRATQLHETRQWFDATLYRVDPPFGLEQHWTRPFDVLLLAGAWVLTPFMGFEKALYTWGVLVSPLLQIASVLFLIWAFASVYNNRQMMFLTMGFIVQPAIFFSYLVGRPDHHSLITFLFIVSLGFVVRMMSDPGRKLWAWGCGFVSALGFWVCIELGVFLILPVIAFLSILWLLREKDIGSALFSYSVSLLLFSTFALLIQNGLSEFFRPEVDRISIIFILFFFLVTLYAFFVQKYDFYNKIIYRILFAGAAALIIHTIMQAVYPQVFSGSEIDPLYRTLRSANLIQDRPIYSFQWPNGIIWMVFWAGFTIPTLLWFVHALFTRKWWQGLFSSPRKAMYVKLTIFVLVCLVFYWEYITRIRYVVYLEIICLLGYVVLMDNIVRRIESRLDRSKALYLARPLAMLIMLTWFYYPLVFLESDEGNGYDSDILATSRYLHEMTKDSEGPLNIMAAPECSAYLLYFTDDNVFSIPNHRCKYGFRDWYYLMSAEKDEHALSIIKQREVDMILINKPQFEVYFQNLSENALLHRLMAGEEVSWLERVETPDDVPQDILIYMVVNGNEF